MLRLFDTAAKVKRAHQANIIRKVKRVALDLSIKKIRENNKFKQHSYDADQEDCDENLEAKD